MASEYLPALRSSCTCRSSLSASERLGAGQGGTANSPPTARKTIAASDHTLRSRVAAILDNIGEFAGAQEAWRGFSMNSEIVALLLIATGAEPGAVALRTIDRHSR